MTERLAVPRDEYGFLVDPADWNRELAQALADELGIGPLTPGHWRIIDYVREHWLKHQAIHSVQQTCRHFGLDRKCIWRLFGGPLELWKVAGLPYPGLEAYTYMENEEPDRPAAPFHAGTTARPVSPADGPAGP